MRIPLNVTAEVVSKLEAENVAFGAQNAFLLAAIAKNSEGISALEPFAEWGEEVTPSA
jgi:hypothetical protein